MVLPPLNDDIANAVVIGSIPFSFSGTTDGATQQTGEPNTAWSSTTNHSVWFAYQAAATGQVAFNTYGSGFDTTLTVWSTSGDTSFGALALVTENDDSPYDLASEVNFSVTAGLTYYIELDGFGGQSGNYVLASGSLNPDPTPTVWSVQVEPTGGVLHLGQSATLVVTLSDDVVVTGTPTLTLNTGATATYDPDASDGTHLAFRFTVGAGEEAVHLDVAGIDLNGGSILSGSAVSADLSNLVLDPETAPGVDGIPPLATLTQMDAAAGTADSVRYEVHFSEAVSGVDASDFQLLGTGLPEAAIRSVTSVDASTYVVAIDAPLGIGTLSLRLHADGSGIADAAGNALAEDSTGVAYALSHTGTTYLSILYEGYLGRAVDADGLAFWTLNMARGLDRADMAQAVMSGSEAVTHQAEQTDAAFVEGLYGSMLGRTPASEETGFWTSFLQHGGSRATVLYHFANSAEAQTHWQALSRSDVDTQTEQVEVIRALYHTALGRGPDSGEIQFYQSAMEQGGSDLTRAFTNSAEFATLHANQSNGDFIEALYLGGLGREAEADGLAFWTHLLDTGALDRTGVTQAIAQSPEAQHHWSLV